MRRLYEDKKGGPLDVEKEFPKSTLLATVRVPLVTLSYSIGYWLLIEQAFQMIFTSPSSARGNPDSVPVPEKTLICCGTTAEGGLPSDRTRTAAATLNCTGKNSER